MNHLVPLFAAAIILASPGIARPFEITEQQQYYDVLGQSLREVNEHMFSGTPVVSNGEKFAASCRPVIAWNVTYAAGGGWCTITSVSVSARITYTMPRWAGYSGASFDKQERWDSFFTRLILHEEGHGRIAREAVKKVEQGVVGLKRRSCRELKEAIDEMYAGLLQQLKESNAQYDARTEHGDVQDAVLDVKQLIAKEEEGNE